MALPYLPPHPGGHFMQQLGGRWGLGGVAPGLGQYPRRDITAGRAVAIGFFCSPLVYSASGIPYSPE